MRPLLILLMIAALLLCVGMASAADYYVSPTGDDANPGTLVAPWLDINYSTYQLVAGDTLWLLNGTWYNNESTFAASGNATHPIIVKRYNGTPTMIDTAGFAGNNYAFYIVNDSVGHPDYYDYSYITIDGIRIESYHYSIATASNYTTIVNCSFYGADTVISVSSVGNKITSDFTFENNTIGNSLTDAPSYHADVEIYGVANVTIANNTIEDSRQHAISLIECDPTAGTDILPSNVTISGNTFDNTTNSSVLAYLMVDESNVLHNITVSDNIFTNQSSLDPAIYFVNPVGAQDSTFRDVIIHNNTISDGLIGIRAINYRPVFITELTVTNNTVNGTVYDCISFSRVNDSEISNNTLTSCGDAAVDSAAIYLAISSHNNVNYNEIDTQRIGIVCNEDAIDNIFTGNNVSSNIEEEWVFTVDSINNTVLNDTISYIYNVTVDATSELKFQTDLNYLINNNQSVVNICTAANCSISITNDAYVIAVDTINCSAIPATGSITASVDASLISIDYQNSTINDLNFTNIDRPLTLQDTGVTTLMFSVRNNIWWSMKDLLYYLNATADRIAVSANTWTTNTTLDIDFTFNDLYPSSNFDFHYSGASVMTNTSNTTGTLVLNNSVWINDSWEALEVYMTDTPYYCGGGQCWAYIGDPILVYLDLNDSDVTDVRMEVTDPNSVTTNRSMTLFTDPVTGNRTWYFNYVYTTALGNHDVNDFYRSDDGGTTWQILDSFLVLESRDTPTAGGGSASGGAITDTDEEAAATAGGGGSADLPEEGGVISPVDVNTEFFADGHAHFVDSPVTSVSSDQDGAVRVSEYAINPSTASLIECTRYAYVDVSVINMNIPGQVCFDIPDKWSVGDEPLVIYQFEDNTWNRLSTNTVGSSVCANVDHFSLFALCSGTCRSVIESLTTLYFTPPKVSGIYLYALDNMIGRAADIKPYTSFHTANRELVAVSTSDGINCTIESNEFPNRVLRCEYRVNMTEEWKSLSYSGEIIAVDVDGYSRKIPYKLDIYNMTVLSFPLFIGLVLIAGWLLYRRVDRR